MKTFTSFKQLSQNGDGNSRDDDDDDNDEDDNNDVCDDYASDDYFSVSNVYISQRIVQFQLILNIAG